MNGINLLPWREERRRARDRQMLSSSVLIWILCCTVVFGGYSYLNLLQDNQRDRNRYLTDEINKLNEKIKEINGLRERKDSLIARMEVIQNLQRQRTQVVYLFDDMVRKLPDGIYFDSLEKKGQRISFKGTAQSNARVSSLMDRLDSSDWFSDPDLSVINVAPTQGVRLSQFDLKISQRKTLRGKPESAASSNEDS